MYTISKLEERIEALENRAYNRTGVVLTGARKNDKMFYDRKRSELLRERQLSGVNGGDE